MKIDFTHPVIIGLGKTGISCLRHLHHRNIKPIIIDSRTNPPGLAELNRDFPNTPYHIGSFDTDLLHKASVLIVSPGVSLQEPILLNLLAQGIPTIGDIELFSQSASAPIVAITGSNGKSTVTTLVDAMAKNAGRNVRTGGNLGLPALDLLDTAADLYVLELSSFQLETTYSLNPTAATVLNISPDHMDRYGELNNYIQAKQRIFINCVTAIINRDDPTSYCSTVNQTEQLTPKNISFGLDTPNDNNFGIIDNYIALGNQKLLPLSAVKMQGLHQIANALAALALGTAVDLPLDSMLTTLTTFPGLPHRCQLVATINDISWYNDSKGTNTGATKAAIEGLGANIPNKLILIAGGLGKNADFTVLQKSVAEYVRTIILIGQDAPLIAQALNTHSNILHATSMQHAVELARMAAKPGDTVLLSPACASYDMFDNFEHRGTVFTEAILAMQHK